MHRLYIFIFSCMHTYIQRNSQLSKEVPLIKRLLESLIFKAREMALRIPLLDTLKVSRLKPRHLDGSKIDKEDLG